MTHAHTTRTIAILGIVLAALVAPATAGPAQTIADPTPKPAPIVDEIVDAQPVKPVIYALDVDRTVFANTIATFEAKGFTAPEFLARFHTTPEPCLGHLGLHVRTSDGVSTVHVCRMFHNPDMIGMARERTMLHEVGHAWIDQNVSEEQIATFMEIRGLTVWDDGNLAAWGNLGAEHAAEILMWGMTDETRNINPLIDDSNVDNLRAAYRILVRG